MLFNPIESHEAVAFLHAQDAPAVLQAFAGNPKSYWYAARTPDGRVLGVSAFASVLELQQQTFENSVYTFVPSADRGKNIGSFLLIWTLLHHQSASGFTGISDAPDAQTRVFLQRNHFCPLEGQAAPENIAVFVRNEA